MKAMSIRRALGGLRTYDMQFRCDVLRAVRPETLRSGKVLAVNLTNRYISWLTFWSYTEFRLVIHQILERSSDCIQLK